MIYLLRSSYLVYQQQQKSDWSKTVDCKLLKVHQKYAHLHLNVTVSMDEQLPQCSKVNWFKYKSRRIPAPNVYSIYFCCTAATNLTVSVYLFVGIKILHLATLIFSIFGINKITIGINKSVSSMYISIWCQFFLNFKRFRYFVGMILKIINVDIKSEYSSGKK